MMSRFLAVLGAVNLCLCALSSSWAEVHLPAIFGDHMVLQETMKIPVWGTATPGEDVTVTIDTKTGETRTGKATADAAGNWRAELPPLPENEAAVTMTVTGKDTLTFNDVLVGDVWVCAGQSNMEFNLGGGKFGFGGAHNGVMAVPEANDPELRLFVIKHATSLEPLTDVQGQWQVCVPATAARFSAVGYFFGRDLRQKLRRPIGLIGTYWGGTPAQAWTSASGLRKDRELQHYATEYASKHEQFAKETADFPARLEAYKAAEAAWPQSDAGKADAARFEEWDAASRAAQAAGQPAPPKPPSTAPKRPVLNDGGPGFPANLYNGMVAPIVPFAIKGTIWYQGEANENQAAEYGILFPRMITDWREKWGQGDFPFLFVQLANFDAGHPNWPFLRESQLKTLAVPNTGMATTIDIGTPRDIHPPDKEDVGHRLALAARHIAYGEKLVYSGPIYATWQAKEQTAYLSFSQLGGGLTIGQPPWTPPGAQPPPRDKLTGFTIAGEDQKFVPADAKIEGDSVAVSSPEVPVPKAVRYDWANNPDGNLYNAEGLPASPFRTDDWSDPLMGKVVLDGETEK